MPSVDEILTAIAPQFNSVAGRSVILDLAVLRNPAGIYPSADLTNHAAALLAAHMLTINVQNAGGGSSGPVISKSVGPLRIAYASPWGAFGPQTNLATTTYGRELQELRNSFVMNPTTRNNPLPVDDNE